MDLTRIEGTNLCNISDLCCDDLHAWDGGSDVGTFLSSTIIHAVMSLYEKGLVDFFGMQMRHVFNVFLTGFGWICMCMLPPLSMF